MHTQFKKRRDYLLKRINDLPGFSARKPHGAFYIFPKFDYKMTSEEMAMYLLEEAHVAMTPGSAFGPASEGRLRLSYANSMDNLEQGMDRIEAALKKL